MKKRLFVAAVGNMIDAIATIILHYKYGFVEANPIMAYLLQFPYLFGTIKLVIMTAVLIWLWKNRNSRYARFSALITAFVYGAISIYYIVFFMILLFL